jgi:serine/threonine protein kinase/WD40 repeat protein
MAGNSDPRNPVELLAEEFVERVRMGERPTIHEYAENNPGLAAEIELLFPALLVMERASPQTEDFRPTPNPNGQSPPLHQLGDFRIIREVGRGGMGVVYEAVQQTLGRTVALKVLPMQSSMDPTYLQRFQREARSAARLHHTAIVPVFEVGHCDGIHYYAMQFIRGHGLHDVLAELKQLRSADNTHVAHLPSGSVSARLTGPSDSSPSHLQYYRNVAHVGAQVADALAYAHGQKILHRDIKPSNILLDLDGAAWVTDFGLAKEEGDDLTRTGDIVGTLRYMAPERFAGVTDQRCDIYGLGLTLYEMVALRPAFAESDRGRIIKRITQEEPSRLRHLDPRIPRDLETIVLRAIAKEPRQRYQTANDLAEDLRRFLADRPIWARRASPWEQTWRWCRRNPMAASFGAIALGLLLVVAVGSSIAAVALNRERVRAQGAQREERLEVGRSLLAQGTANLRTGLAGRRLESLELFQRAADIFRADARGHELLPEVRDQMISALGLTDMHQSWSRSFGPALTLACDAQLERYAIVERGTGEIVVRRVTNGAELMRLPRPNPKFWYPGLAFSGAGTFLAMSYEHAGERSDDPVRTVDVWQLETKKKILTENIRSLAFLPDSRRFAFVSPAPALCIWDLEQRREMKRIALTNNAQYIAFDGSGKLLAINEFESGKPQTTRLRVLEVETGAERALMSSDVGTSALAWCSDGRLLASAAFIGKVYLWDTVDHRLTAVLTGHTDKVVFAEFLPPGQLLLTGSWDGTTRLWNRATGECLAVARGMPVQISFNGHKLMVSDLAHLCRYEIIQDAECITVNPFALSPALDARQRRLTGNAEFSDDGKLLAVASAESICVFDARSGQLLSRLEGAGSETVLFHPNGRGLLTYDPKGLRFWPMERIGEKNDVRFGSPKSLTGERENDICKAIWLPGKRVLAITDPDLPCVRLLDMSQPEIEAKCIAELPCKYSRMTSLAVTPDGQWLASGGWYDPGIQVWNLPKRELVRVLTPGEGSTDPRFWVAFTNDGQNLFCSTISEDKKGCYVFRANSWNCELVANTPSLMRSDPPLMSPDGNLVAFSMSPTQIRLADPATGRVLAHITTPSPLDPVPKAFSPDGTKLAVSTNHGLMQIWDLKKIRKYLSAHDLDWDCLPYPAEN